MNTAETKEVASINQQPEQKLSQVRDEIASFLVFQEAAKAEAFKRLPDVIEQWAEVVRQNRHILEELQALSEVAHVSIPFGYGLLPDLNNPVVGITRIELN